MPLPRRAACALLAAGSLAVAATPADALTRTAVRAALSKQAAKLGSSSGQYVLNLDTGDVLWSKRPDTPYIPASNQKLFTTSVALRELGGDMTLPTSVVTDGTDLFLVGGGDPTLSVDDLSSLAEQLVAGGLTKVKGAVAGDETIFDTRRGSASTNFAPDYNLSGRLGGLTISHGATDSIGPAHLAAAKLQELLKAKGVTFGKAARVGAAPDDATDALATVASPPISALIAATNQPSDNFYAETLLKDLGAYVGTAGTTPAGAIVARDELATIDVKPTIVDGSGLSRVDRTNTRQVVTLLKDMAEGDDVSAWRASLAVAGRSGTLAKRMRGTAAAGKCRGKTGTLSNVSALSGYCTTAGGQTLAFSFLENDVSYTAKSVEDQMAIALARLE